MARRSTLARHSLVNWWSRHAALDGVFAATIVGVHGIVAWSLGTSSFLDGATVENRTALYEATAAVGALVFGFATAAIAFFYGAQGGKRLALLAQVEGRSLVRTWRSVLAGPLVAVAVSIICLIADRGTSPGWVGWLYEFGIAMLALRLLRLQWLFGRVLVLTTFDATDTPLRPSSPATGSIRSRSPIGTDH